MPYKGVFPVVAPLRGHRIVWQPHFYLWQPPTRGLFLFALFLTLTRKRVHVLLKAYLVISYVLLQLVPYVLFYCSFVLSYRIHIIILCTKSAGSHTCISSSRAGQISLSCSYSSNIPYPPIHSCAAESLPTYECGPGSTLLL